MINEFSSGTTSDWVELYNTSTVSASLSNLRIRDSAANKKDLSGELEPGSFLLISFSNWLNNNGDIVRLMRIGDSEEETIEEIPYGDSGGLCAPGENGSIGKRQDGGSAIVRFAHPSKGESNNQAEEDPCPTATPVSSNTPQPTPKPTDTPSPTKGEDTKSNQANPSPTKTSTRTPSLNKIEKEEESILGEEIFESTSGAEEDQGQSSPKKKSALVLLGLLLGGGTISLATAVYLSFKQTRRKLKRQV